jgi:hypothetical protein
MGDGASKHAFEQFKSAFQIVPMLWIPYWNKSFLIYCDAFEEPVGSTLSQLDKYGHQHPIHFASKKLISVEKKIL